MNSGMAGESSASNDLAHVATVPPVAKVRFASIDDSSVAVWIAKEHLSNKFLFNSAFGWMSYARGVWTKSEKHLITESVRQLFEQTYREAVLEREFDSEYLKKLHQLLSQPKIAKIVELLKGLLDVSVDAFDKLPEHICVGNGVVNLRTMELSPHSPTHYMTLNTTTPYLPGSTHPDWESALAAAPPELQGWLQTRLGQGITGYTPDDDVLPLLLGAGANGKSTFLAGIRTALGPYASAVNEKVLLSNPGDHPTELMSLRGLRLGFIEELPEDKKLPVKRLKDLLGVPRLQARYVHRDNVEWATTHTLFVTTNYLPIVTETDFATWRRLKVAVFPYKFVSNGSPLGEMERVGDPQLRPRLLKSEDGQAEAVLDWLIDGAHRYLTSPGSLEDVPPSVEDATQEWRLKVDVIRRFHIEYLEADPESHIISTELFEIFNEFLQLEGFPKWSDQGFSRKFETHELNVDLGVKKKRFKTRSGLSSRAHVELSQAQYMGWAGIKLKPLGQRLQGVPGIT